MDNPMTFEQLRDAVADLPLPERLELTQFLVQSFDVQPSEEVRAAWLAPAESRLAELRTGTVKGVPADELLESLELSFIRKATG